MAIFNKENGIRKRLFILTALLETETEFIDNFLTIKNFNIPVIRLLYISIKAGVTVIIGYLLAKLLKWI
jgi:hypothetical protein